MKSKKWNAPVYQDAKGILYTCLSNDDANGMSVFRNGNDDDLCFYECISSDAVNYTQFIVYSRSIHKYGLFIVYKFYGMGYPVFKCDRGFIYDNVEILQQGFDGAYVALCKNGRWGVEYIDGYNAYLIDDFIYEDEYLARSMHHGRIIKTDSSLLENEDFQESEYIKKKKRRCDVYRETLQALRDKKYKVDDETIHFKLEDVQSETKFYDAEHRPDVFENTIKNQRTIEVWNSDCIDAAKRILDEEKVRPIVLNMASYLNPGGGVAKGSSAQEENLFRRSDYCRSLYQYNVHALKYTDIGVMRNMLYSYPLGKYWGAVYSPGITVFRGNEAQDYPYLKEPFILDFVAIAAQSFHSMQPHVYTSEEEKVMRQKIDLLLQICQETNHTHLVLSALGCGAFHNSPESVAQIFKDALESDKFKNAFKHVVFAIMDNSESTDNYNIFKKILG